MLEWFRHHYPDCPPLAHIIRERFPWRWFRIHSLPESKRYPESAFDNSILLTRHHAVADAVLGVNSACNLIMSQYGNGLLESSVLSPAAFKRVYQYIEHVPYIEDDFPEPWVSWASPVVWNPKLYDEVILAVANAEEFYTLFISPQSGGIYAPYDGGADLFHIDTERLDAIKSAYQQWASPHPHGL